MDLVCATKHHKIQLRFTQSYVQYTRNCLAFSIPIRIISQLSYTVQSKVQLM